MQQKKRGDNTPCNGGLKHTSLKNNTHSHSAKIETTNTRMMHQREEEHLEHWREASMWKKTRMWRTQKKDSTKKKL